MIILVGNEKRGCGKSTLALNIAAVLARRELDVILVGADRAASHSWIVDRSADRKLLTMQSLQTCDRLRDALRFLERRYEYVVVDTPGSDCTELLTGLLAADVLLVPFRPSGSDFDVLPKLREVVLKAKDLNETLEVYAVLTMAPTNTVRPESSEAAIYLKDYPDFALLETVIHDRKSYSDCLSEGKGVVELHDDEASEEIRSLIHEILTTEY